MTQQKNYQSHSTETFKQSETEQKQAAQDLKAHANAAAKLIKALANPNRLMILCLLSAGELSVTELNQKIDLTQSALSQHLAKLRFDQLVSTRRESQTIYYSLANKVALEIIQILHQHYCPEQ